MPHCWRMITRPIWIRQEWIIARGIAESAIRMDGLIRDLLDYGRLAHLKVSLVSVKLEARLGSVLAQLRPEIKSTGAVIQVERPLPPILGNSTLLDPDSGAISLATRSSL